MDNIKIWIDVEGNEQVTLNRGNDEFTTMLKSVYDEQQAALKDK